MKNPKQICADMSSMGIKTLDDIPKEKLVLWAMRLYSICNLAWDYIDSVCDLCSHFRIDNTKSFTRTIKQLKRNYDIFRQSDIHGDMAAAEAERGVDFEEMFHRDFSRLNRDIRSAAEPLSSSEADRYLFIAVMQAMALANVAFRYGRWCDKQIKSYGIWACNHVMIQSEFLDAYPVLHKFINPNWPAVNLKPHIVALSNRLHIFGRVKLTN